MINLIKYLGMAKKGWGVATTFFSAYRLYFIVGGFIISFIAIQQYRINSRDTTIAEQLLDIANCQGVNDKNLEDFNKLTEIHDNLVNKLEDNKNKNEIAIIQVKAKKKATNEKIKILKERVIVNTCTINADNIKLLKEANNQN